MPPSPGCYWRSIDAKRPGATAGSATGLGRYGAARLFEAPHTEQNYLIKEVGYRVARRRAATLRRVALALGCAASALLAVARGLLGGAAGPALAILAAVSAISGVPIEPCLFFAEAKHVVTLYYGAESMNGREPATAQRR